VKIDLSELARGKTLVVFDGAHEMNLVVLSHEGGVLRYLDDVEGEGSMPDDALAEWLEELETEHGAWAKVKANPACDHECRDPRCPSCDARPWGCCECGKHMEPGAGEMVEDDDGYGYTYCLECVGKIKG